MMGIRRFVRFSWQALVLAAAAAVLSGCAVLVDSLDGDAPAPIRGPLTRLTAAKSLALFGGHLFVSNRYYTVGIAVIDTAADTITGFHRYDGSNGEPWMFSQQNDSLLYVETQGGNLRILNMASDRFQAAPGSILFGSGRTLICTADRLYTIDRYSGVIRAVSGDGSPVFAAATGGNLFTTGLAVAGNRLFVTRQLSRHLLILEADKFDGGVRDSLDIAALTGDTVRNPRMSQIVAHGGRLFIALNKTHFPDSDSAGQLDTATLVVINATTLALEKIIPLRFHYQSHSFYPLAPRVVGNTWYLIGTNDLGTPGGGVETIDLETAHFGGSLLTSEQAGGDIVDFLPTHPHGGYAIVYSFAPAWGESKVKRVSY